MFSHTTAGATVIPMIVLQPNLCPRLTPKRLIQRHIQGYSWKSGRVDSTLLVMLQRLNDAIIHEDRPAILMWSDQIKTFHSRYRVDFGYTVASVICPAWMSYANWIRKEGAPSLARPERHMSKQLKFPIEFTRLAIALHQIIS